MPLSARFRQHLVTLLLALSALAAVAAIAVLGGRPQPPPPLTSQDLSDYLAVAGAVRSERRAARQASVPPEFWAARPALAAALQSVGWNESDYLRVEGQVAAARLRLEDPVLFAAEFAPADAPEAHVALVAAALAEVRAAQAPLPDSRPTRVLDAPTPDH